MHSKKIRLTSGHRRLIQQLLGVCQKSKATNSKEHLRFRANLVELITDTQVLSADWIDFINRKAHVSMGTPGWMSPQGFQAFLQNVVLKNAK